MMRHYVAAILVLAVAGSTWAGPAGPTTQPAKPAEVKKPESPAPAGQALKVTVVSVSGPAQKMTPGAAAPQWEPLKADDKLDEMTIVRTGLNATVVLRFEDRGQFTINSATKIGISEFRKEGSVVKGEVGLKYGSVHASVDSSRGATSFQVSTPVATLSVRGSTSNIGYTADGGAGVSSQSGNWQMTTGSGGTQTVGPNESGNSQGTLSVNLTNQLRSVLQVTSFGLTGNERNALLNQGTGRGSISFGSTSGQGQGGGTPLLTTPPPPEQHIYYYP
jgi:hypothetical protein